MKHIINCVLLNGKRDPLLSTFSASAIFVAFVVFGFFVFETAAAFAPAAADDPELLDFAAPEIIYLENAGSQSWNVNKFNVPDVRWCWVLVLLFSKLHNVIVNLSNWVIDMTWSPQYYKKT